MADAVRHSGLYAIGAATRLVGERTWPLLLRATVPRQVTGRVVGHSYPGAAIIPVELLPELAAVYRAVFAADVRARLVEEAIRVVRLADGSVG